MGEGGEKRTGQGPGDYWRLGPVYVQKRFALLAVMALSAAVLAIFGLPFGISSEGEEELPAYRYNDPDLAGVSGRVRVLDDEGQARYVGEVELGAYTGRGKVFDKAGELLYDGPLADGVYEGRDVKVYRDGKLIYTGEMANGRYEGQGRRSDPDTGIISEGQFSGGALEGQGREFYGDGTLLREGTFSRDLLEGEGCEYGKNGGLLREGTFSAGMLHGQGREYTASGKLRYEGQFWRGVYHGEGTLYNTLLGVRSAAGTFEYGELTGQGALYHPSGQLLYTGQVCGEYPSADAFLGLSLAEVEEAFTAHWLLYSCEDVTAFVYPYFHLMFVTESPIELVSPTQTAEESERERQELLEALERPAVEAPGAEDLPWGDAGPEDAGEKEDFPEPAGTGETADAPDRTEAAAGRVAYAPAAHAAESRPPAVYEDEQLSADTDKPAVIITQVLSYKAPLPGVAQPSQEAVSGRHHPGWREWFSDFALDGTVQGVWVRQSGQFIWRFTPQSAPKADEYVEEFLAEDAGVETMTVRKEDKDMPLWYQTARRRDGP